MTLCDDHLALFETKCRFAYHVSLHPSIPGNTRNLVLDTPLSSLTIAKRAGWRTTQARQPNGYRWLIDMNIAAED